MSEWVKFAVTVAVLLVVWFAAKAGWNSADRIKGESDR